MKRIYFDILLFISIFIFPWWVSFLFLIIGIFLFDNFYEFIIASLIIFIIYSPNDERLISSPLFFSSTIIVLYFIVQYIRSNIILYKK